VELVCRRATTTNRSAKESASLVAVREMAFALSWERPPFSLGTSLVRSKEGKTRTGTNSTDAIDISWCSKLR